MRHQPQTPHTLATRHTPTNGVHPRYEYTETWTAPASADAEGAEGGDGVVGAGGPSGHEEYEDGRWKCGLCGNVNYKHQKSKCNMRNCQARRYALERPCFARGAHTRA